MSPPVTKSTMNGQQEPVAKYIGDLDSARTSRLPNEAVNRDINPQFRMQKTASEEKHEDTDEKGFLSTENEGFVYNTSGSPLLCPGQEVISCLGGNEDSASISLDISSPTKCLPKSWKSSGKGKKRKKPKSGNKKRPYKRQKVDVTTSAAHQQPTNHKIIETTRGRSSETSSKAGCKPAQQPLACLANGGMCCRIHGQRCGGGGGGDDGDGRPPKKPPEEVKCGHAGKQKPKKKKPAEAEEQPEVNTTTNNMIVDERNDSSEEIRDVEMVSQNIQQNNVPQVQPEQSSPRTRTEELLTQAHVRINHHSFCKKLIASCERCQKVEAIMHHFFEEMHGKCMCCKCQLWLHVLKYHTHMCKHKDNCKVCMKYASQIAQGTTSPEPQVAAEQENFPTCRASLDEDEQVIWKNPDIPDLTCFKEDRDYVIDKDNFYRKGGHGTVCKVLIPDNVKKKYFSSTSRDFIMKEANELGEDELYVFREVWRHPNFVQTFVVVKKMNVEQPYRILMEKCEMSLKDYLNQLLNQNKRMSIDEAMFYWIQVFDAIKHLHFMKIGVIHKDVKAENVLLTIAENLVRVKLADFDTVKLLHNKYTIPGLTAKGTLGLVSLEVLKRESHGRPADVWNMAMFLFQLLFPIEFSAFQKKVQPSKKEGLHMFIPRYESLLKEFLAKTIPKLKQVDEDLGDLIECCLREDPLDRPTAVEVLENRAVVKYVCRKIDMGELIGKICPDWKQ